MRKVIDPQLHFGEQAIGAIHLDPKSRDDIPQILRGLQYLYTTPALRERVFAILQEVIPAGVDGQADPDTGRPGMAQWKILVLGALRLGLDADYDRLQELANQHSTIRQMLGHSDWADEYQYELQTLKDNLRLFTPEILDRLNQEVVRAGHRALKKSPADGVDARCDTFVVETNVHYPTDINLLLDAIRKTIEICADLCAANGLTEWRQSAYQVRQFKKSYRQVQQLKRSTAKDTRLRLEIGCGGPALWLAELDAYIAHAERQIDQIRRRVLLGERIPHAQKLFSLFEPHTEWINKGKAGVPVELGLRVAVVEDSARFILHHRVMEKTTDDQIAVSIVAETQARFPALRAISMDKGFHSPRNQTELKGLLERVVLPKKGKRSEPEKARESDPEFIRLRHQHSAVESAINALEAHGLDRCPDHGIEGFKRYVALAVVARNIQRLGAVLRRQDEEAEKRKRGPYKKAA